MADMEKFNALRCYGNWEHEDNRSNLEPEVSFGG